MKKAQWMDLFREIKKNSGRYLSLLFIVALGTAFYAGVRSSQPDMTASADYYYDTTGFMDIRILGTLGLTGEDLEAVKAVDGIGDAEGGYRTEAFAQLADSQPVMEILSAGRQLNQMTVKEGRMPQKPDECFMDEGYMETSGCQIGDTVTLADEKGEAPGDLKERTFTITGSGTWSWYLSRSRTTASIGDGSVDAFMVVPSEAFDVSCYQVIYASVEGAEGLDSFSDAYEDTVSAVKNRLEDIAGKQCDIRYGTLKKDGEKQLSDARKQVTEGEKQLSDAKAELESGEAKYQSGRAEYETGKADYEAGMTAWEGGKQKLQISRNELEAGQKEYDQGKKRLDQAMSELKQAKQQIREGEARLADARQELETAGDTLKEKQAQLAKQEEQLSQGLQACESQEKQLTASRQQLKARQEELDRAWADYESGKKRYEEACAQLEAQKDQMDPQTFAAEKARLEAQKKQLDQTGETLTEKQGELDAADQELTAGQKELEARKAQLLQSQKQLAEGEEQLKQAEAKRTEGLAALQVQEETLARSRKKWEKGNQQAQDSEKQLLQARQKLMQGQTELEKGEKQLEQTRQKLERAGQKLEEAKKTLAASRNELDAGWKRYNSQEKKANSRLLDARNQIREGEEALEALSEADWYVLDRGSVQSQVEYGMDAERIGAIGKVFPAIFFLVAALVSLTTMTRMIEEERTTIGTMKALGYGKFAIASKYILYALSATLAGGILGVVFGSKLLPYVIMSAYGMLYNNVPYMMMPLHPGLCLFSIGLALLCTVGAAFAACYKTLLSTPAALMRPPAPKQGKRVFLEYLPFLWKRLNFSMKSTIRNLVRYKKRFFMTVFGIGGCMSLLLVSFGLHDSIAEIVNNQYKKIWTYSAFCGMDETCTQKEQQQLVDQLTGEQTAIEDGMLARKVSLDVQKGKVQKNVYFFVPENPGEAKKYLNLHDRVTGTPCELGDDGVIITEKLASLLGVKAGDFITLKLDDTTEKTVLVTSVAENYLYHYVYLTPDFYEQLYGRPVSYNELYLKFQPGTGEEEEEKLAKDLLEQSQVQSVSLVDELQATVDNMMNALNLVVWVLIFSAGLLVFVVLFNLNHINISERRRELASLKVLGFYDQEVAAYVYRENIFLTLFGILAGLMMGTWLHQYTIRTLEVDMIMFGRDISLPSDLYSILFTAAFAVLVNLGMYYKFKQIDMVESLKSVE